MPRNNPMLKAISNLFSAPPYRDESHALYVRIVEQARAPEFYTSYGVPDTLDGRFDLITLHMFLAIDRLKKIGSIEAMELLRAVSEVFFADMDRSLREMGSSDTGVGKRIKNMSQAFYGRQLAYQTAGGDTGKLQEALLRNVYRGDLEKLPHAAKMAEYVRQQIAAYAKLGIDDVMGGNIPGQVG